MEVSSNLNKFSKKQVIKNLEKQLEVLKNKYSENNKNDKIIKTIEESIRNYYKKEADAAKIRSRVKWTEEGEKSTRYFFNLEKKRGQNKLWNRIKTTDGRYKYDIDSIKDEQVKFYSELFKSEGWE